MAEYVAQVVMRVLHQKYSHVTDPAQLVPLALQITRFKLVAQARKSARRGENRQVDVDEAPIADQRVNLILQAEQNELLEKMRAALPLLGERCREIFRLKLDGLSFPEIQAAMGALNVNTVYTWEARCREDIKRLMTQTGRAQ